MYGLLGIGPAGGAINSCNQALCYVPNKPTDTGHLTAILTYACSKTGSVLKRLQQELL